MRSRKTFIALLLCVLTLFSACATQPAPEPEPAPAPEATEKEIVASALYRVVDAGEVSIDGEDKTLAALKTVDGWDVSVSEAGELRWQISDALYAVEDGQPTCVAPFRIKPITHEKLDKRLASDETTVGVENHKATVTFDLSARVANALRAMIENRDARLGKCIDAILAAVRPDETVSVRKYKNEWTEKFLKSGEEPFGATVDAGVFALFDRLAAKSEKAADIAAFLNAHKDSTVNQTFLDLLQMLSPDGDPVKPETAVKVLTDTLYSKYFDSNTYTLEKASDEFGLDLYGFSVALETLATSVRTAYLTIELTIDDAGLPIEAAIDCAIVLDRYPQKADGTYVGCVKEKSFSIAGELTLG